MGGGGGGSGPEPPGDSDRAPPDVRRRAATLPAPAIPPARDPGGMRCRPRHVRAARGVLSSPPGTGGNAGAAGSSPAAARPDGTGDSSRPLPIPAHPPRTRRRPGLSHQDAFIGARRPAPPTGDTRSPRDARSPSGTPAPPQRHPLPLRDTRSPGQPHGGCDDPVGPGVPHSTPPSPVPPHPPAGEGPGALAGRGRGRRGHPGVRVANASCIFWRQRA